MMLNKGDRLDLSVAVAKFDIGVQVDDPSEGEVLEFIMVESGDFLVMAEKIGVYKVIIDNSYSGTDKNITQLEGYSYWT